MAGINPYLYFNGDCEEAFNLYRSVFGGEFVGGIHRYKDMPPTSDKPLSESEGEKVMHIGLPIGQGNAIMGSDVPNMPGQERAEGNNIYICINAESRDEAERFFNGLSEGGTVKMPMGDTFWGAYFGMLADKFGIHWMINHEAGKPQ
jgi:PhnB protein